MLPEELLKKVRLIEFASRKVVDEVLTGQYKSHFKGQGVQFSEHRLYVPGDDIRHIDWKVSARSRDPLIKKYDEEREMNVFLLVDLSGSKGFGSSHRLKSEVAAELAGVLAYAAIHTGDKVGALLFASEVEKIIPPKKGKQHVLRVVRDLLSFQPKTKGTDLAAALDSAGRIMKHSGIIFVISDFMSENYEFALKRLSKRHDVVALIVSDPREGEVPDLGQILFTDPETGAERLINTSSYQFKKWFEEFVVKRKSQLDSSLQGSRVETLRISTDQNYADAVVRFFRARSRRKK